MPRPRRRRSFWLVLIGTTACLTVDPALCLVVLAVGLSALALTWIVMLARLLLVDALLGEPPPKRATSDPTGGGQLV